MNSYNPKWLEFIYDEGLSPSDFEAMSRQERTRLNARFFAWVAERMTPDVRKRIYGA